MESMDLLCEKWSHEIQCGQLSSTNELGYFLYRRLGVKKGDGFIGLFRDHTKKGYLLNSTVPDLKPAEQGIDPALEQNLQSAILGSIPPTFDLTVPDKIDYAPEQILTPDTFFLELQEHPYIFIKFYHRNQYASREAVRVFERVGAVLE